MVRTSAALLGAVATLVGCNSNSGPQIPEADFFVQPGQPFLLRVGDTGGVVTSSAVVLVRFGGVLTDSRCPTDVNCVQAGAARALLSVQTTLAVREVELDVPPDGGVEVAVEEVTLRVREVRPAAQSGVSIDPISYQIVLSVTVTGDPLNPP